VAEIVLYKNCCGILGHTVPRILVVNYQIWEYAWRLITQFDRLSKSTNPHYRKSYSQCAVVLRGGHPRPKPEPEIPETEPQIPEVWSLGLCSGACARRPMLIRCVRSYPSRNRTYRTKNIITWIRRLRQVREAKPCPFVHSISHLHLSVFSLILNPLSSPHGPLARSRVSSLIFYNFQGSKLFRVFKGVL